MRCRWRRSGATTLRSGRPTRSDGASPWRPHHAVADADPWDDRDRPLRLGFRDADLPVPAPARRRAAAAAAADRPAHRVAAPARRCRPSKSSNGSSRSAEPTSRHAGPWRDAGDHEPDPLPHRLARADARPGARRRASHRHRRRDLGGAHRGLRHRRGTRRDLRGDRHGRPARRLRRRRRSSPATARARSATSRPPTSTRSAATSRPCRTGATASRRPSRPDVAGIIERTALGTARASCSHDERRSAAALRSGRRDRRRRRRASACVRATLAGRRTELPLRYWRQQAHLTTPAADAAMARKAVEGGTAPVGRMLERLGSDAVRTSRTGWSCRATSWRPGCGQPARAPLVMLDGEDAIAPGDDAAAPRRWPSRPNVLPTRTG